MSDRSSIFDMIGPVMIGPSSSHTAGVVRIGRVARKILRSTPEHVTVTWYNSFATTYEGHGSDRALLGGLMDYKTDDDRIREALKHAEAAGMSWKFQSVRSAARFHPNSIRIEAKAGERAIEVLGISRGGGIIKIAEVDDFHANFSAQDHTLIIKADDVKGSIAFITQVLSNDHCNIATMTVDRRSKNDRACLIIEMDSGLKPVSLEYLSQLDWIRDVVYIPDIDM